MKAQNESIKQLSVESKKDNHRKNSRFKQQPRSCYKTRQLVEGQYSRSTLPLVWLALESLTKSWHPISSKRRVSITATEAVLGRFRSRASASGE